MLKLAFSCPPAMRRNLSFFDAVIEDSYRKSLLNLQHFFIGFYLFCLLLIFLGMIIKSKENMESFAFNEPLCFSLGFTLAISIGFTLIIMTKKTRPKYIDRKVLFLEIISCLAFIEIYLKLPLKLSLTSFLLLIIPLGLILYLPVLFSFNWRFTFFSSIFHSIYLGLRAHSLIKNYQ